MIRRFALSLLFLLSLTCGASAVGCAGTGSCFWEGGTGNWSDTTKWCTTNTNPCTGTTGGLPTSADNCNFTSASNTTAYTVTQDQAGAACKDMTWALPSVSGVPTFAGSVALNVAGSLTKVATMVWTWNGALTFSSTTTGKTITSAGVAYAQTVQFTGAGGGWTLLDAFTNAAASSFTVSNGTLVTGAFTHSFGSFVSTSGTRTLTLDNSTINITGTSGTPLSLNTTGALTFSATGATFNVNGGTAGATLTIAGGGVALPALNITAVGLVNFQHTAAGTVKNFSYTSSTNKTDQLIINPGFTIAASGSLTLSGNSVVNRAFVLSNSLGTQRTITVPNTATVTLTNVDFQDIASAGTFGTWTGTSLGDALGNSGITFDASVTLTWDTSKTGAQNWSGSNWLGTTNRVPLPQDDWTLPSIGSATTITEDMPRVGRNGDMTNFNRTLSLSVTSTQFGNLTFGSGMTSSNNQAWNLGGRGSQTIAFNTHSFSGTPTLVAFGGTYTLQDAHSSSTLIVTNGTYAAGANTVSIPAFSSTNGNARAISGSGVWSISNTTATPWNVTNLGPMVTSGFTGTIKFTGNVTTNITFAGGGGTWPNIWWSNIAATGTLIITGANTFNNFKINRTTARTITFPAATTTTISSWTDESLGTAVLTIISSSAGSQATLSKSSGIVNTDYLSLKDNAATGGATFFAGSHSSIVSNVTGWNLFGPGGGGFLTLGFGQ